MKAVWPAGWTIRLFLLCFTLLAAGSFSLRAQERDAALRFYFPAGRAKIDESYLSNAQTLQKFRELVRTIDLSNLESVVIEASSSPEGAEAVNRRLSVLRGEELGRFLQQSLPALKQGKVSVKYLGENWKELRTQILTDPSLSDDLRSGAVLIIDDEGYTPRLRKFHLNKLPGYEKVEERYYPLLRYANLYLSFGIPDIQLPALRSSITLEEEELVFPEFPLLDTRVKGVEKFERKRVDAPLFALSTNLVFDAALTPNVNLEVPLGRQWSLYTEYTFPWWVTRGNNRAWQIQKLDLGARYWFNRHKTRMDALTGHFIGLDAAVGYYDIEPNHRGWQGEAVAATLEYGYAWYISTGWRASLYIGAGWMGTQYRYYQASEGDKHLLYDHTGRFQWLGPTKLGCSIQYLFHYRKKGRK